MDSNKEILESIDNLRKRIIELSNKPVNTSKDGITILETLDGSCVKIVHSGIYMLLSYEAYDKLSEYYKEEIK